MANTQGITRDEIEARLVAKAWADETFKQQLINDAKAAIEQEFGQKPSEGIDIRVLEETDNTVYLVIPKQPETQLSEKELETVAGGSDTKVSVFGLDLFNKNSDIQHAIDLQKDIAKSKGIPI